LSCGLNRTTFTLDDDLAEQARALITNQMRGLAAEVDVNQRLVGLERLDAINCDGLHTIAQSALTKRVGMIDAATMNRVCRAMSYSPGC
jgi:mRNA-degrading endonuclease toxin of MazEF toxin-antitoxin module